MKPVLLFDLDGPLLDVRKKYHQVYSDLIKESGALSLELSEYWQLKRTRAPERSILAMTAPSLDFEGYWKKRNDLIESEYYLGFDQLQAGALDCLRSVSSSHTTILVTMRGERPQLLQQLESLGLLPYLQAVLCAGREGQKVKPSWTVKTELVRSWLTQSQLEPTLLVGMIGDTETDIEAAQALKCRSFTVLNGIRSKEHILTSHPTSMIDGIHQFSLSRINSSS